MVTTKLTTSERDASALTVDVARLFPPQGQWTEDAYLALPESNYLVELSDGELIMMSPATETHQRVLMALFLKMHAFIEAEKLGTIRFAPLPVRLWPDKIRKPDILFVSNEHADRIGEKFYGPPDLVVEVVSPSTRHADRVEKFTEYAAAGIPEYWLVDPEDQTVEVFTLQERAYVLEIKVELGESARSQVLEGFSVPVDEVFSPA